MSGNEFYQNLCSDENAKAYPIVKRHTPHSWRQRYLDNKAEYDKKVTKYAKAMHKDLSPPPQPSSSQRRPSQQARVEYTNDDDMNLVEYLAMECPLASGRLGNNLYMTLVSDEDRYPWGSRHSWQSWRDHYKHRDAWFDKQIALYQKRHKLDPRKLAHDRKVVPSSSKNVKKRSREDHSDIEPNTNGEGRRKRVKEEPREPSAPPVEVLQDSEGEDREESEEQVDELQEDSKNGSIEPVEGSSNILETIANVPKPDSGEVNGHESENEDGQEAPEDDESRSSQDAAEASLLLGSTQESQESVPGRRESISKSESNRAESPPSSLLSRDSDTHGSTPTKVVPLSESLEQVHDDHRAQSTPKQVGTTPPKRKRILVDVPFFETPAPPSPQPRTLLPRKQRELPKLAEGPYNTTFTDSQGRPQFASTTKHRLSGVDELKPFEDIDATKFTWPPRRGRIEVEPLPPTSQDVKSRRTVQSADIDHPVTTFSNDLDAAMVEVSLLHDEVEEPPAGQPDDQPVPTERLHHDFSQPSQLPVTPARTDALNQSPAVDHLTPYKITSDVRARLLGAMELLGQKRSKPQPKDSALAQHRNQPAAASSSRQHLLSVPPLIAGSSTSPSSSSENQVKELFTTSAPPNRRHTILGGSLSDASPFTAQPRGALRTRFSLQDGSDRSHVSAIKTPRSSTVRSSHATVANSTPQFEGKQLNDEDRELALQFGMTECLRKLAETYQFQYAAARDIWIDVGSLVKTEEILKGMHDAAFAERNSSVNETLQQQQEKLRVEREEAARKEEEERLRQEQANHNTPQNGSKKNRNRRKSKGFNYTPVNAVCYAGLPEYIPPSGSRAAQKAAEWTEDGLLPYAPQDTASS
ncbi:hypothetical protein C8Q75DRAFT_573463 [Abortiporus biennis]|nr:hypothetical protein C8Q75DRAFT_573463 [Abortiporus biennis]